MKAYQNILIVRTDRIGDVVLTTPAIRAMKEAWPAARLTVLVTPATRELVEGNPYIDEVLVDDRSGINRGLIGFLRLVRMIRSRRFDLAIVFHTKKRTNFLCFVAGIPARLGYRNEKYGFLLTHPIVDDRHHGIKHEAQYCLEVLKTLGIKSADLIPFVPIHASAEFWAYEKLAVFESQAQIVAVHPASSDPAKMWPTPYFVEVMQTLAQRGKIYFILIGDQRAQETVPMIRKALGIRILNLVNQTTVGQLAAILKHCDLLISNDSGPVHIADALGVPVVSIFTRNQPGINPERWRPLSSRSIAVAPSAGSSGLETGDVSLELISPQQVLEAVDAVFKLC